MNLKKLFAVLAMVFIALAAFSAPASAAGSDSPTPYTVDANGVTLPAGQTFQNNGHVNIKYRVNGGDEQSKNIHFEANNNQPSGFWIGKSNIPWSGFGLSGNFCVTWVQVHGFNEHFGEGGQAPYCSTPQAPDTTPNPINKKVTLCHATGPGKYNGLTIDIMGWYNGHRNHQDNRDIWAAFSYTNIDGQVIHVPARGDVSLLAHPDCQPPAAPTKVVPSYTFVDKCETKDDRVDLVPGNGYTGGVTKDSLTYTIVANTSEGFVFDKAQTEAKGFTLSNGDRTATNVVTLTDVSCDLPVTGGEAQYNTTLGLLALGGFVILGAGGLVLARKKS